MKINERISKFLELQNKNIDIDNIAKEIGITVKTLRSFLNKNGYKLKDGKYVLSEESEAIKNNQISFEQVEVKTSSKKTNTKKIKSKEDNQNNISKSKKESTKKDTIKKNTTKKDNLKTEKKENKVKIQDKSKTMKVKKDKKINLTQEDLDKLCEVYDWYLQVKDLKSMKPKKTSPKRDINIEKNQVKELKTTSIRVDKNTWEDFERLCSNSDFTKQEIITQALKDFMKEYKNLL